MSDRKPPFSKTSEGYQRLLQLFDDGTIGAETAPKLAFQLDPIFDQYNLSAFRAGLNKIKTERNMHLRQPTPGNQPSDTGKQEKLKTLCLILYYAISAHHKIATYHIVFVLLLQP